MSRRFRHGLVLGKFLPLHAGHSNLIRTALARCDRVTVQLLAASAEPVPITTRLAWLREEHPTADVVAAIDDAPVDFDSPAAWDEHMRVIERLLREPVDAAFTSDAYGAELARRLGAEWVRIDAGRAATPVSGTAVREDTEAYWWALGPAVRASLAARVVVLGAESTGTTTLADALAAALGTARVQEYGRDYSGIRPGGFTAPWRSDEFDLVVDRQLRLEAEALRRVPRPLLVCDTDVLATALWHERYTGEPAPRILERASTHRPLLYVLTGDEIPFVQDGMRDGEHIRAGMQQRFRDLLALQPVPWFEVHGSVEERLSAAVPQVEAALARHHLETIDRTGRGHADRAG